METKLEQKTAKQIFEANSSGKIQIPDVQREGDIWSEADKQLFIDSLYNNFPIPKLIFRVNKKDVNGNLDGFWWVLEGQQRSCWAIDGFFNNHYPLGKFKTTPKHMQGKYYHELDSKDAKVIEKRKLQLDMVSCTDKEEAEVFIRSNKGKSANAQEKRNGELGDFRTLCVDIAENTFFKKKLKMDLSRYKGHELAAQLVLLEMSGGPSNVKKKALDVAYKQYKIFLDKDKYEKQVDRVLKKMNSIFFMKEAYMKKGNFLTLYLVLSDVIRNYTHKKVSFDEYHDFFDTFLRDRALYKDDKTHVDYDDFDAYTNSLTNTLDNEQELQNRHDIVMRKFLEAFPRVQELDKNRDFTQKDKETIYFRANKRCEGVQGFSCPVENEIHELNFFEYDHFNEHIDGGKTIIENGKCLCYDCHEYKTSQNIKARKTGQTVMF